MAILSLTTPEAFSRINTAEPNALVAWVKDADDLATEQMAMSAVYVAQQWMPKVSGSAARGLQPVAEDGYYGISWGHSYVRYLERGTRPRTMRELAGKTIPMWVDDSDGQQAAKMSPRERQERTRVTEDGRRQVKIFRKAAPIGSRKTVIRNGRQVSVPRSYPGAPGRINRRDDIGKIAGGNVGVRWRHPGIQGRDYVGDAILYVADSVGIRVSPQMAVVSRHTVN